MAEDTQPRTLYVGNLDPTVQEDLLLTLFSQIGVVRSCKIIREAGNDPYAFLEFENHTYAATALSAMNRRLFLNKEMKVNWATSPGNQPKLDTSQHHHIFVGDLSPEIETDALREAFAPFGEISNCRIVRDPQTLKSKGYAFVSFVKKAEAESAIAHMNGQWLGSRSIRTNWSTRKPPPPKEALNKANNGRNVSGKTASYEEIYNQTGPNNTTVYCGGFPANVLIDEMLYKHFTQFGSIQDIRLFKDKGYAFVKFSTKDSAARAIENTHNTEVQGYHVKCFWGKENNADAQNYAAVGGNPGNNLVNASNMGQTQSYTTPYSYQMGYWYQVNLLQANVDTDKHSLLLPIHRDIQHSLLRPSMFSKDTHIRMHMLPLLNKILLVCISTTQSIHYKIHKNSRLKVYNFLIINLSTS